MSEPSETSETSEPSDQRVVVVTGGGGGIGAAIAAELSGRGDHVVALDPMVSLDGSEVVAAGDQPGRVAVSVTDRAAVIDLVHDLVDRHGRLDAVINVAGITRPTGFARGTEDDWRAVLEVHLDGYRNVLDAALPVMAAAGRGSIVGVTSGSGWRAADAGAYSCAKRAVAALTWQLGRVAPPGVTINAISPIAVTRMVTEAMARAGRGSGSATGGLALGSMPQPEELAPLVARLLELPWCQGQVVFAGGSEAAVVRPPQPLEVVRTDDVASVVGLLAAAEERQATTGGGNPRLPGLEAAALAPAARRCLVVSDRPDLGAVTASALRALGVEVHEVAEMGSYRGFDGARSVLAGVADLDTVIVIPAVHQPAPGEGWQQVLADHAGIVDHIEADAAWARAAADLDRPLRLVTLIDAASPGGRSRAQASTQLARASRSATSGRVTAATVAIEGAADGAIIGQLAAHLAAGADTEALSGAELAVGDGWLGLRSHPRPTGSIVYGGPALPHWFDGALRELV